MKLFDIISNAKVDLGPSQGAVDSGGGLGGVTTEEAYF
jgi:hypothetical protein